MSESQTHGSRDFLCVARWSRRCTVLGPGRRAVVWVQGCPFRCPGCVAREMQPFHGGEQAGIESLGREIAGLDDIDGVTFSGGEPMCQAGAICALVDVLRARRDLSVMAYTGFVWEDLTDRGTPDQKALLSRLDILVDGPYVTERHTDLIWRGSDNQRVLLLTGRHRNLGESLGARGSWIEFEVDHDGLQWMGIPPRGFREAFENAMRAWGLPLTDAER